MWLLCHLRPVRLISDLYLDWCRAGPIKCRSPLATILRAGMTASVAREVCINMHNSSHCTATIQCREPKGTKCGNFLRFPSGQNNAGLVDGLHRAVDLLVIRQTLHSTRLAWKRLPSRKHPAPSPTFGQAAGEVRQRSTRTDVTFPDLATAQT